MSKKIIPVLLAGGSGTRLWPLSRKSYPKQFAKILGSRTLFQTAVQRLRSSRLVDFTAPTVVTNADFRFIVKEQLLAIGEEPGPILIEPVVKNTGPAILAACLYSYASDPDAVLLVSPSDHNISDELAFHEAIRKGLPYIEQGKFVTFGISPTKPETGFGYLELAEPESETSDPADVISFVEKPDLSSAQKMFDSKRFAWNSGIFLFRAQDMITAFENLLPDQLNIVKESLNCAQEDLGFLRISAAYWSKLENISIDYAIMEKFSDLVAVPYLEKWSDLGGWDSVWTESNKDITGTVTSKGAHSIDCTNTLLRSESDNQQVVGLGLENIMAVAMPDAVLVAHKDRAQDVKEVVAHLRSANIPQSEIFPIDHRPWGWFESLVVGESFQVKRIFVKPGAALSLQSHKHRSEHWIVVEGSAKVTIGDEIKSVEQGESVYVPLGVKHRMENLGVSPMVLIEVQIGSYLGEDDIVRYEDVYARS